MEDFATAYQNDLVRIFTSYKDDTSRCIILFQPESLLVFEHLERDPYRLKKAWIRSLDPEFLVELAHVWGRHPISYDDV